MNKLHLMDCMEGMKEFPDNYFDLSIIDPPFFDPRISWKNKWKNKDYTQGPAYFGSTTFLSWTSDYYHAGHMGRNAFVGLAILVPMWENRKWYVYCFEAVINFLSYSLGFNLTYHVFFQHKY